MPTRPYKNDLDVAASLLRVHASPMDVLAFRVYEWKTNDADLAEAERNTNARASIFLPVVVKAFAEESWAKEYKKAFRDLDDAEKEFWKDVTADKIREAWVKVASLVWFALDERNGGDFSRSEIAKRYDVNPGTVTKYLGKAGRVVEPDEILREGTAAVIPLSLDYESPTAENYYTEEERQYYIAARQRYSANEGEFDLENPIISDIIHQIILNSYVMQKLNREVTHGQKTAKPVLLKRLNELQDANAKGTKELIGLQNILGKLERNEESLGALKRQYLKVKEARDPGAEAKMEAELFELTLKNSRYLGFEN